MMSLVRAQQGEPKEKGHAKRAPSLLAFPFGFATTQRAPTKEEQGEEWDAKRNILVIVQVGQGEPSVMVYKSFLIDHHFCIFRGIFASF